MNGTFNRRLLVAALCGGVFAAIALPSEAALFNRRAVRAEVSDSAAIQFHRTAVATAPAAILPDAPDAVYVRPSCVTYKMHQAGRRVCCDCPPPMSTVLIVKNPKNGCCYAIPVCLPGCCDGPPTVNCLRGLLGRGVVHYRWCCGFEIKVVFRARGDVVVHYYGSVH